MRALVRSAAALLAAALLAVPAALDAQRLPARCPSWSDDPALAPGRAVRVTLRDGTTAAGRFVAVRGDTLLYAGAGDTLRAVAAREMRELKVRVRRTSEGVMIGAIGAGSLYSTLGRPELPSFTWRETGRSVRDFAIGGAAGALVGGLAGAAVKGWHRVYPAPRCL